MRRALMELPIRQRTAVVLRYFEDLSEAQTAELMRCRPSAVKSLVSRGMTKLRTQLEADDDERDRDPRPAVRSRGRRAQGPHSAATTPAPRSAPGGASPRLVGSDCPRAGRRRDRGSPRASESRKTARPTHAHTSRSEPRPDSTTLPELRRIGEIIAFERTGAGPGWDLAARDLETASSAGSWRPKESSIARIAQAARTSSRTPSGRPTAVGSPSTSPSGVNIPCLFGPSAPTARIWVSNALGVPRQLTTPCESTPTDDAIEELWAWSPGGAKLAYARIDGETDELFVCRSFRWQSDITRNGRRRSHRHDVVRRRESESRMRTAAPSTRLRRRGGIVRSWRTRSPTSSISSGLPTARGSWSSTGSDTGSRS